DVDVRPRGFVDVDPSPINRRELADEMPRQPETEIFDLADRLASKREDGVLLRVGGDDLAVVAADVGLGEIAGQRDGDGEVLDRIPKLLPVAVRLTALQLYRQARGRRSPHRVQDVGRDAHAFNSASSRSRVILRCSAAAT